MNSQDKALTIKRYANRYREHGYSPLSLGWGKGGRQKIRFGAMAGIGIGPSDSVLDVGCGFGDFQAYLKGQGWKGRYLGIDFVDDFLLEARKQHPQIRVKNADILSRSFVERFDFVVSSGIFNTRLKHEKGEYAYIRKMMARMLSLSRKGVACDFISSYVDFRNKTTFHAEPEKLCAIAKSLSRRVLMRHDYLPFEFMVYMYTNDGVDTRGGVFK
ncbi:MAG: hypothetical protein A2268_15385 [Candidatus Raymondbacteria bacterium RifOxyA12_full_50_37]|uniref:Methyltransferase domain-containing protein n=1 Tax=Candidatus Raymondbacteria bacterium RIFOXYD12_FULL_49_13 TaxID=1817890 RepID=A0A1F7F796_UNCRA|nr:MAG: hypothetical protein A2268_15385 [Candidatus Raymondbacteria bacterium RifOxyA12_full_50_37]OGJ88464.1 MAG: hypothetical protein A2248_19880 [Candidatus Raymondbacteria bacterium RIFOXYA2_FULL_49_16]OGJ96446.1 MAG: hypothetical protein A2350_15845 [Candidatus Raymondbacteria bacterium RifOxyB12_full_50_8]OGJ98924.1 MAG: hypothetical protein A2453_10595 [Candidatus Raymondbacteria bacterium RIFOXYC2_FULL_50_21]OGK02376.1 MAG: hypothetical protein A2519_16025 [Candidatus Raymondbacteria b